MSLNFKVKDGKIDKNLILIAYLETIVKGYLIKSEISSNDEDTAVIVVQMASGPKEVMFSGDYLYDNFTIEIFGNSIREQKQTAYELGLLPGNNVSFNYNGKTYQLLFKAISNPTNILYQDIRRVGYTMTLQVVLKEKGV